MKKLLENWRSYKKIEERINTLDSGKRFISGLLVEISDDQKKLNVSEEALRKLKIWGELEGEPDFLGSGSKGSSYLFGNRVLKITSDTSEVQACMAIIGKIHPNVYDVYKVGSLPEELRPAKHQKYAIVYEFLDYPNRLMLDVTQAMHYKVRKDDLYYKWKEGYLGKAEQLIKQLIVAATEDEAVLGKPVGQFSSIQPRIDAVAKNLGWDELEKRLFTEFWTLTAGLYNTSLNSAAEMTQQASSILNDPRILYFNQLALGLTFLYKNGIIFNDLKMSNIMEKNSEIAIIDIGYSIVTQNYDIPEI